MNLDIQIKRRWLFFLLSMAGEDSCIPSCEQILMCMIKDKNVGIFLVTVFNFLLEDRASVFKLLFTGLA